MTVALHPRAQAEYDAVIAWYAAQDLDAALAFDAAVGDALARIAAFPSIGPRHRGIVGLRSLRLAKFPFLLPYRISGDHVLVLAIAHSSRRPDYWSRRR